METWNEFAMNQLPLAPTSLPSGLGLPWPSAKLLDACQRQNPGESRERMPHEKHAIRNQGTVTQQEEDTTNLLKLGM
jgi:hypothetical protein